MVTDWITQALQSGILLPFGIFSSVDFSKHTHGNSQGVTITKSGITFLIIILRKHKSINI
jgi:hypothetical protein